MKLISEHPMLIGRLLERADKRAARRATMLLVWWHVQKAVFGIVVMACCLLAIGSLAFAAVWVGERLFHLTLP